MPKNTAQCLWLGLEPGPLDLEVSALTMRPPCHYKDGPKLQHEKVWNPNRCMHSHITDSFTGNQITDCLYRKDISDVTYCNWYTNQRTSTVGGANNSFIWLVVHLNNKRMFVNKSVSSVLTQLIKSACFKEKISVKTQKLFLLLIFAKS